MEVNVELSFANLTKRNNASNYYYFVNIFFPKDKSVILFKTIVWLKALFSRKVCLNFKLKKITDSFKNNEIIASSYVN